MRTVNLLLIAAALAMAFALYKVKYDALASVREIRQIEREIGRDREAVIILKAEWSHLNQPGRLETLAKKHLGLDLLQAEQVVRMTELPDTPAPQDPYRDHPTIGDLLRELALTDGESR